MKHWTMRFSEHSQKLGFKVRRSYYRKGWSLELWFWNQGVCFSTGRD